MEEIVILKFWEGSQAIGKDDSCCLPKEFFLLSEGWAEYKKPNLEAVLALPLLMAGKCFHVTSQSIFLSD